ncbi:glutamate racemase [Shewanella khirikhana]|uniref:Glutamate racemase n=1 Tax=Shewanella khirikhana TaxID=1965282 RepID=A0ABM7DT95_9GAMM|nr:glutamate racemase [Shewanella khirikhana]AZQ12934.1 Glutamate racemase [Shewanella khirikhana]
MQGPILVFDSGIGGLSVLNEIRRTLPARDYCYLFDNARLPYGELKEDELISGCVALVAEAAAQIKASLVVIACNTASTLVLPALRAALAIPVVGVVPAIKPAAQSSQSGIIGLIATPGTVRRSYTHDLVAKFASHCQVHMFGSSELVVMAEAKMAGQPVNMTDLSQILAPVREAQVDVLVLGCTHFPLLAAEFSQVLGDGVMLLDSGKAIASRVAHLLAGQGEHECQSPNSMKAWYTTPSISGGLSASLHSYGFTEVRRFKS